MCCHKRRGRDDAVQPERVNWETPIVNGGERSARWKKKRKKRKKKKREREKGGNTRVLREPAESVG